MNGLEKEGNNFLQRETNLMKVLDVLLKD